MLREAAEKPADPPPGQPGPETRPGGALDQAAQPPSHTARAHSPTRCARTLAHAAHANPRRRRYAHSPIRNVMSRRKLTGMSHNSFSSMTVVPRAVYAMSSGSADTVSGE